MFYNQNGDKFFYNIVVTNNSPYADTNVTTVIDAFPAGISFDHVELTQGSYNSGTRTWVIPTMPGKTTTSMRLWMEVTNATLGPFSIEFTTTGTLVDPNTGDNTQTLTAVATGCAPDAGATADTTSCLCIDVSANDTECTYGVTEWRLNELSIVNGVKQYWDESTGMGGFTPIDPTLPITGTYDLWCVAGVDEYQKSCGVSFTIYPQLVDKDVFDHTISIVEYGDLTAGDIAILSAQYPTTVLADFCWGLLKNADGDTTSGWAIECDETIDTRTFFFCTAVDCTENADPCPCPTDELPVDISAQFPVGYTAENGDTIYIQHPNGYSVWTYDGTNWNKWACGCVPKISADANNLITLGTDDAPYIDGAAILAAIDEKVKVSANDTTSGFLNGKLVAGGGITLTENNNGANETLTIAATLAGSVDVQVQDSCSVNMSIEGTGDPMDPYIISAVVYDDTEIIEDLGTLVDNQVGETLDTAAIFGACPGGCSGNPAYTIEYFDPFAYADVTVNTSGILEYTTLSIPTGTGYDIIVKRDCNGFYRTLRVTGQAINGFVSRSILQAGQNTQAIAVGGSNKIIALEGGLVTVSGYYNVNPGSDQINIVAPALATIFKCSISGNLANTDFAEEDFTIEMYKSGSPFATPVKCVFTTDDKYAFSKEFLLTLSAGDVLDFRIYHSNLKAIGLEVDVTITEFNVFMEPIYFAV